MTRVVRRKTMRVRTVRRKRMRARTVRRKTTMAHRKMTRAPEVVRHTYQGVDRRNSKVVDRKNWTVLRQALRTTWMEVRHTVSLRGACGYFFSLEDIA